MAMDRAARKFAALAAAGLIVTGTGAGVATAWASTPHGKSRASAGSSASPPAAAKAAAASPSATATVKASASASASPSRTATTAATASPSPTPSAASGGNVPRTTTGQSQVLTASQQSAKVGAIFSSSSITPGNHHCTASVVDSPAGDLIVTAGHCLSAGGTSAVFVPGYRDGSAPDGVWHITQVIENSAWTGDGDQDDDVAFAVVAPQNGRSLESSVGGGYTLSTSGTTDATVQLTGYPSATDEPITCTGDAAAFSQTQLVIDCTAFTGGTSGTAWLAGYDSDADAGSIIGVIGGYQQGGDTADVSYSIVFGADTQALYEEALSQ
ncbi:trypsin-like serine peptidase [Streptacidiphilus anmyonensis]|uniref:trypsin-like serine peptidase n=1 Tax=Streptacidiphilus anmyonensis TaxID=405782 RepID=UPI000694B5ED|nr:hypothetical protein [Streptacidiphilus anmyonensis]